MQVIHFEWGSWQSLKASTERQVVVLSSEESSFDTLMLNGWRLDSVVHELSIHSASVHTLSAVDQHKLETRLFRGMC